MARLVLLDASPLWLAAGAPGKPMPDACRAWIRSLEAAGSVVVVPEIADYEVRRELLLRQATAGIRRLDCLRAVLDYQPITTQAMLRAAEFWAILRQGGVPTAHPQELDGDAVLAGQAAVLGSLNDTVTIATSNVGHLGRFPGIDAQDWDTIA